jgi:hypothetical protein
MATHAKARVCIYHCSSQMKAIFYALDRIEFMGESLYSN